MSIWRSRGWEEEEQGAEAEGRRLERADGTNRARDLTYRYRRNNCGRKNMRSKRFRSNRRIRRIKGSTRNRLEE